MAEKIKITLNEGDNIVLQSVRGGGYVMRLYRDGRDKGLLPGKVDAGDTLVVEGSGKNASINIPANILFAPRLEMQTDNPPSIFSGPFVLTKESKQDVLVPSFESPARKSTISQGGLEDDKRFPKDARVMSFSAGTLNKRYIAIEDGATADIEIVNPRSKQPIFTLEGKDSLQESAQKLGIKPSVSGKQTDAPPEKPAGKAPAKAPPPPDTPLNGNQMDAARSMATQIGNMRFPVEGFPSADFTKATAKLKGDSLIRQDLIDFKAAVAAEADRVKGKGKSGETLASILENIQEKVDYTLDKVSAPGKSPATPKQPENAAGKKRGAELETYKKLQETAGHLERIADGYERMAQGTPLAAMMTDIETKAKAAKLRPTPEALDTLDASLKKALDTLEKSDNPRAPMFKEKLREFREKLDTTRESGKTSSLAPALPDDVMVAAGKALDPSLKRQTGVDGNQNSIERSSGIPNLGGNQVVLS